MYRPNTRTPVLSLWQMLVTLPAICSLVVGQISGWMSNFAEKRHLILIGLILFGAGGLGGYAAAEFWQLFLLPCPSGGRDGTVLFRTT